VPVYRPLPAYPYRAPQRAATLEVVGGVQAGTGAATFTFTPAGTGAPPHTA
jgi:hypothetical protein